MVLINTLEVNRWWVFLMPDMKLSVVTKTKTIPIMIYTSKQQIFRILSVKAALAIGKNHKALLMMMRATAPSAVTASDATTTSGLGSGLGSGS